MMFTQKGDPDLPGKVEVVARWPYWCEDTYNVIGADLLAQLLKVNEAELERYRETGKIFDSVKHAMHVICEIVWYLSGNCTTQDAVRNWFLRTRKPLGGKSPKELFIKDHPTRNARNKALKDVVELARQITV